MDDAGHGGSNARAELGSAPRGLRTARQAAMDRTEANTGTREVSERLRFDERALERWMADHVDGFAGPLTVSQFKGGQSNPTYRLDTPSGRPSSCAASRPASCCPAPMRSSAKHG